MRAPRLKTNDPRIVLVEPDVERDAPISVTWLAGEEGHNTLALMGVTEKDNHPSSLEKERARVQDFIDNPDQLNWMIQADGKIVGSIWVNLTVVDDLTAPAVHLMIGEPSARDRGVGQAALITVVEYIKDKAIYSRYLTRNLASKKLLQAQGFEEYGSVYKDHDGLVWQNVFLKKSI